VGPNTSEPKRLEKNSVALDGEMNLVFGWWPFGWHERGFSGEVLLTPSFYVWAKIAHHVHEFERNVDNSHLMLVNHIFGFRSTMCYLLFMRIHVLSDLHLEFAKMPRDYSPPPCDVIVLAGDISPGLPGVIWANEQFTCPVIYVPGNHEYYVKRSFATQIAAMKRTALPHVHILDNETVDIDGVRFIGSTLWTDFDLYGQNFFHQIVAQRGMADYTASYIEDDRHLTSDDTVRLHMLARYFLTEELMKPFNGEKVVVTHHGPSEKSVAPRWHLHPLTPAFTSRMEGLILEHGPKLWVHGHTHDSFDYVLGNTRIVVNPRGYFQRGMIENMRGFKDQLVIDV
jgi:predicted phosphodiesterase